MVQNYTNCTLGYGIILDVNVIHKQRKSNYTVQFQEGKMAGESGSNKAWKQHPEMTPTIFIQLHFHFISISNDLNRFSMKNYH